MASKRPASDIHPSRREQVPNEPRPAKRQKPDNLGAKSYKKAHPTNTLKTQVRSLKRLLEKKEEDLPPKIRIEKERALASALYELEEEQKADKRGKMIARYHKVRFFDRQKGTKRLRRARKGLRAAPEEERELWGKRVDEAEVDVSYAIYYPLEVPYAALFPSRRKAEGGGQEDGDAKAGLEEGKDLDERQGDPKMRELVRKCLADGKLDMLKNGKLDENGEVKARQESKPAWNLKQQKTAEAKQPKDGKRKAEEIEQEESENESDGGFFE